MSYEISIPSAIERKLERYNLSPIIFCRLLQSLQRDANDENYNGLAHRVIAPVRCAIYRITLIEAETSVQHDFCIWLDEHKSPGTRYVIDVAHRQNE